MLLDTPLVVAPVPRLSHSEHADPIVTQKDEHVAAACLAISAPYLLTLDKQLEDQVNQAEMSIQAFSPGGFIKSILRHHENFPSLRA